MSSTAETLTLKWVEITPGLDRVSEKIGVTQTSTMGFGLNARETITPGSIVMRLGGHKMSLAEYRQLPKEIRHFPVQIDVDTLIGPRCLEEVGTGDMLNHSCDPNVGFMDTYTLIALRPIYPGEAITLDYALSESFPGYSFVCQCNNKNCRGRITTNDWKIPELQKRYSRFFQPYLKKMIGELTNNTLLKACG